MFVILVRSGASLLTPVSREMQLQSSGSGLTLYMLKATHCPEMKHAAFTRCSEVTHAAFKWPQASSYPSWTAWLDCHATRGFRSPTSSSFFYILNRRPAISFSYSVSLKTASNADQNASSKHRLQHRLGVFQHLQRLRRQGQRLILQLHALPHHHRPQRFPRIERRSHWHRRRPSRDQYPLI